MFQNASLKAITIGSELNEIQARIKVTKSVASSEKGLTLGEAREAAISNSRLFEAGISIMALDPLGQVDGVYEDFGNCLGNEKSDQIGRKTSNPLMQHINLKAIAFGAELNEIQARIKGAESVVSSEKGLTLGEAREAAISNSRLFEAGISMMVLDSPGQVGSVYDDFGNRLEKVLKHAFDETTLFNQPDAVIFNNKPMALREVFVSTVVAPLTSEKSDQIGRKTSKERDGIDWIVAKLAAPLMQQQNSDLRYAPGNDFKDLLTKIKAINSFGTTVWQLMKNPAHQEQNGKALKALLMPLGANVANAFIARFDEFKSRTRTERFDDGISRMRSERPLQTEYPVKYSSASEHALGFGKVLVTAENPVDQPALNQLLGHNPETRQHYSNINGVPRHGAPIEVQEGEKMPTRPFTMSKQEIEHLPKAYDALHFDEKGSFGQLLDNHAFAHGTGVNRWQAYGTFATESGLRGLPSAGAQSGGTCDILLALQVMSDNGIYEQFGIVEPATLGIAAFMNFGAYHTFAETIPIGMAVANGDDEYNPSSGTASVLGEVLKKEGKFESLPVYARQELDAPVHTDLQHDALYDRLANLVGQYAGIDVISHVAELSEAHKKTLDDLKEKYPELNEPLEIRTLR